MQFYSDRVTDQYGNVKASASVSVLLNGLPATIYSDDGVTTQANPITTASDGSFSFYAANGTYTLSVSDAESQTVTLLDYTEAATATPLSSSTVLGETGGVVQRFAQDEVGPLTPVTRYGTVADGSTDDATALQAGITAARTGNHSLFVPSGHYAYGTGLTVEMSTYVDGAFIMQGEGYNASPTSGGTCLRYTGNTGAALSLSGSLANNQDGSIELRNFAVQGASGTTGNSSGAKGINCDVLNNALLHNLYVGYHGGNGIEGEDCFSLEINRGLIFNNFGSGVYLPDAANRVTLRGIIAFGNGRDPTQQNQANLWIYGSANAAYGPVIDTCDVSYAGRTLYKWSGSEVANITNIVVAGGVATVTTATAHGRTTGDWIAVNLNSTAGLETGSYGQQITVTSATAFTYPCSAADGTYTVSTDADLICGTQSYGCMLFGTYGASVRSLYCENPLGGGLYVYSDNRALTIQGGFMLNARMVIDQAQEVEIGGVRFQGSSATLVISEANQRPTINLKRSSCSFVDGAAISRGDFYMEDGVRYGNAQPSSGTWFAGEKIYNSAPSVSTGKILLGWVRKTSGGNHVNGTDWEPMYVTNS